jgi:ATP-dependent DNA helicase RecG
MPLTLYSTMTMQRLTDDELLALLNDTESDRAERKETFKGDVPRKARQAVCAFANDLPGHDKPGVLFIGAMDNGEPTHLDVTDQLLLSLADVKTDGNILPLPVLTVEKRALKGAEMAVVTVMPSDMPPVKYEGRIWIRTGPRRAIANEQEERILNERRRYKNLPFDIYPVPTAKLSDLSRVTFEAEYLPAAFADDVLEENGRTYEERLASCRMIVSPDDTTPTVTGLLALGKTPQDFLPGAYVQFLRIDGTELADPVVDEEKIGGSIADMLRRMEEKLRAHNRTAIDITVTPTHQITNPYPQAALQQIVYNAVLHRTYERTNAPVRVYWFNDRIEISSPGGPYGNVTRENFGHPGITDYRNPNMADVLKTLGFIQAFGRGIATARRAMERNGNPQPVFEATPTAVLCTLPGKS